MDDTVEVIVDLFGFVRDDVWMTWKMISIFLVFVFQMHVKLNSVIKYCGSIIERLWFVYAS